MSASANLFFNYDLGVMIGPPPGLIRFGSPLNWEVSALQKEKQATGPAEIQEKFRILADSSPVALWMAGSNGKCIFFNQYWLRFTGRTLQQEIGDGWAEGVHPMDFQHCMDTFLSAF